MSAVLRRDGLRETSWNELFKPQVRIRSKTQFGPGAFEATSSYDAIELSYGLGDTFTPLEWENYVPYDRASSAGR